jgi:acyl-CoA synthetase (AMP-forming)/AMP-acid ligase II
MGSLLPAIAAAAVPDTPAIQYRDGRSISYAELLTKIRRAGGTLRRMGVSRHDRVVSLVPPGPGAALTFLSVASWASSAPLNPAFTERETGPLIDDLRPKLIVSPEGREYRGVPTITPEDLWSGEEREDDEVGDAGIALILHTSGTTARPKLVPLTHRNLLTSAHNVAASLALTPSDRALGVMPLFHIHGLVGVLLSTLVTGGRVICLERIDAEEMLQAISGCGPTWYSAVPTIHHAVLEEARRAGGAPAHSLRLIRSSSSALPPQLMRGLEEVFGVPVIEAYGMTEASHQMASNPLPPRPRKAGSVGMPAGPEIAVLDAEGRELGRNMRGEVAVRGENVTAGYLDNDEANAKSFTSGWFRTGDEGYLDEDGYLVLTGRLKEMINRGGEKIAPVEIDRVLLDHPAVSQAVTFAVPHPRLGEDVGAAIVVREGATVTPARLRAFARERLAAFKVPALIAFVQEIPRGPTGKPQRIGLAAALGIEGIESPPPATPVQIRVAAMWAELLGGPQPRLADDFLLAGGDSIIAAQLLGRIEQAFGVSLSLGEFFADPSLEGVSAGVEARLIERVAAMSEAEAAELLARVRPVSR